MANRDRGPKPAAGRARLSEHRGAPAQEGARTSSVRRVVEGGTGPALDDRPGLRREFPYCAVIDRMMTGVVGTASWAPCRRVCTRAMASTMSIPSTTSPKTA